MRREGGREGRASWRGRWWGEVLSRVACRWRGWVWCVSLMFVDQMSYQLIFFIGEQLMRLPLDKVRHHSGPEGHLCVRVGS